MPRPSAAGLALAVAAMAAAAHLLAQSPPEPGFEVASIKRNLHLEPARTAIDVLIVDAAEHPTED